MSRLRRPQIHIVNPFADAAGSPMRALALYELLAPYASVTLWSEYAIDQALATRYPIRQISLARLQFPQTGVFVIVGVYFRIGRWYYLSRPHRVILVNNMPRSHSFDQRMRKLTWRGWRPSRVEVVFASEQLKEQFAQPGRVEYSLIDLHRFTPARAAGRSQPFTVGRISRDAPEKHNAQDPAVYRRLAQHGCRVRLLGGAILQQELGAAPGIDLLPFGAEDPVAFLQGLDAFYYRTAQTWLEPFGRVVAEAMACGLPVVCHQEGGYAEIITHGKDGYLFQGEEEALAILLRLRDDAALRREIGANARRKVEKIYSPQQLAALRRYYLA